jgi:hypothetical protein
MGEGEGAGKAVVLSLFAGVAAGLFVALNGAFVRKKVIRAALAGGDFAVDAGKRVRKAGAQLVEDFQDELAEVKAEREGQRVQQESLGMIAEELQQLRADIASLRNSNKQRVQ